MAMADVSVVTTCHARWLARPGRRLSRCDDRGSITQFPIMAVVFVMFIALVLLVGRVNNSYQSTEAAARYSARTISLARDPAAALDAARSEAERAAGAGTSRCSTMEFSHQLDVEQVTVTITCQVDLSDVDLWGMPGAWTVTATAAEPVDQWREAAP